MSVSDCSTHTCQDCGVAIVRRARAGKANGPWPIRCPSCQTSRKRCRNRDRMRLWSIAKAARDPEWAAAETLRKCELDRRNRQDPAFLAKEARRQRERYRADPGRQKRIQAKYRAAHQEECSRRMADWKRRNWDVVLAHSRRHWHLRRAAGPFPPEFVLQYIREASGGRCAYCGSAESSALDHIRPVSRGGTSEIGNLTFVCKSCNSSKNARPLMEWWNDCGSQRARARQTAGCSVAGGALH